MKQLLTIAACIFFILKADAQSVAINTDGSTAAASAILDVKSTGKGVLAPRMSKAQKNAITIPATGLLVFQDAPDSIGFYYYSGAAWLWLATANNTTGWTTTGNAGTDTAVNFIGTTDNMPLRFKQNNGWLGQLNKNTGNYFLGSGAGQSNTSGKGNTAMGDSALFSQSFSNGAVAYSTSNTAFGSKALFSNQPTSAFDGFYNTAIGGNALYNNTSGAFNTGVGESALFNTTTGFRNIAIGDATLYNLKTGGNNVAIGSGAGSSSSDSMRFSVLVGESAGGFNKRDRITAVGYGALTFNAFSTVNLNEGKENTAIGFASEQFNVQGSKNTSVGYYAMFGTSGSGSSGSRNVAVGDSALAVYSSGSNNIAIGASALSSLKTGIGNVAVGNASLRLITTATNNTSVGDSSMTGATSGSENTAVGAMSLSKIGTGVYNTAVGSEALKNAANAFGNTGIGRQALVANTSGGSNTAAGHAALFSNTTGGLNVAIGASALVSHRSGNNNTVVGTDAMFLDTTGINNIAMGNQAMFNSRNTIGNIAIGTNALNNNRTGNAKLAIGTFTLFADTSAGPNTAIGNNSLGANTKGQNNIAIGFSALRNNTVSSANMAIGDSALFTQSFNNGGVSFSSGNTAVGYKTLFANQPSSANDGNNNTAIGNLALTTNTNGNNNTAVGNLALNLNTNGISNVAVGANALEKGRGIFNHFNVAVGVQALQNDSTSFGGNTGIGFQAGMNNSGGSNNFYGGFITARTMASGNDNTVIGSSAMQNHISGDSNVVIGTKAMGTSIGLKKGNYNTAMGFEALFSNDTSSNTGIGYRSLRAVTNGADNTAIGINSGNNLTTGTNNTFVGALTQAASGSLTNATAVGYQASVAQNNSLILGSISSVNGASATVNVGIGTNTPDARLHIVRNGISGGTYHAESGLILENSSIVAMQFSTPNTSPALIRSGNAATDQRSGITFEADSSINFNSGGSVNRMIIDNTGFVGVRTSTPASYLDVSGSIGNAISTSTASTTLDQFDHTHIILPTASAVVISLPAANTCARREYTIVNEDNSVQAVSSYIDFTGAANITLLANTSITIQSNGTSWFRIR